MMKTVMHMNRQIETLLKNGYKKEIAQGIAALEEMLDREPELAARRRLRAFLFANVTFCPRRSAHRL